MNRLTVICKDPLEMFAHNQLVWLSYLLLVVIESKYRFRLSFIDQILLLIAEDDNSTVILGMDQLNPTSPNLTIKEIVKSLIDFIASR